MKYSQVKAIKAFTEYTLHSQPDWREVVTELATGSSDFWIGDVRFIKYSEIDKILADELQSDLYCLGCFTAWFIADATDLDLDVIEALQDAEAFEALGKLIIKSCNMIDFNNQFA